MALALILGLAVLQEDPAKTARGFIEQLHSPDIEARDEALRKLKALGRSAKPALEEAAKSAEGEVAVHIRRLLARIPLLDSLTPDLQRELPAAVDRLAAGDAATWAEVFLDAESLGVDPDSPKRTLPRLKKRDLEALAPGAIRGASISELRLTVLRAFIRRNLHSADEEVLACFDDPAESVRSSARRCLHRYNPPSGLPARISQLMGLGNNRIRVFAMEVVDHFALKEALASVKGALRDPDGAVREAALSALGEIGGDKAHEEIAPLLQDPASNVRIQAVWELAWLRAPEFSRMIAACFRDEDESVAISAIQAIGRHGDRATAARLVEFLDGNEPRRRAAALTALKDLGATEHADRVESLLKDENTGVLVNALRYLEALAPKKAGAGAIALIDSPHEEVRRRSLEVIGNLKTREAVPILLKRLSDKKPDRDQVAKALGLLGDPEAIPVLTALMGEGTRGERGEAITALSRLGSASSAEKIMVHLKDESDGVRVAAVQSLRRLNHRAAVPALVPLLSDPMGNVRYEVVIALKRLQGMEAAKALIGRLDDEHGDVVQEALWSLIELEHWDAAPRVLPLLEDLDRYVREAAATFLVRSGSTAGVEVLLNEDYGRRFSLNALRRPEAWKRLNGARVSSTSGKTWGEALRNIVATVGFKLDDKSSPSRSVDRILSLPFWAWEWEGPVTAVVALERHWFMPLVLESDSVRVQDRAENYRFWREWWKDYQASKK